AEVCPKNIISVLPVGKMAEVRCQNKDKGAQAMKVCAVSCIGCTKCVKTCQHEAISFENNLATIIPEKCVGCGECVAVCPKHAIVMAE
ncbi:MAG: 4Fe-4S binding protein, partial [Pygmaiobacter massiliensis]